MRTSVALVTVAILAAGGSVAAQTMGPAPKRPPAAGSGTSSTPGAGSTDPLKPGAMPIPTRRPEAPTGPPGSARSEAEDVRRLEEALRERGIDPGPLDGMDGERTRSALRRFQRAQGLPDSGRLDPVTRTLLGLGD